MIHTSVNKPEEIMFSSDVLYINDSFDDADICKDHASSLRGITRRDVPYHYEQCLVLLNVYYYRYVMDTKLGLQIAPGGYIHPRHV